MAHRPRQQTRRHRQLNRNRLLTTTSITRAATFVVAALFVAATAGPAAADPDAAEETATPAAVVSLGDSYSSGLGAGDYQDDCDRTPRAWGHVIFGDAVTDSTLLACSGAQIPEVLEQVDQLAALPGEPGGRLITVTVGGNDVGFADELINCLTPFVSCLDREAVITERIEALHDPLVDVYTSIQAAAPGDEIIVGGYPMLVPDPAVRADCPALTGLLSTDERQMIRRLGVALNDAIDAAASTAGVESAGTELEQVFDGHEACANDPGDWLYGLKISWPSSADGQTPVPQPDDTAPGDTAPGDGPTSSYEQQWAIASEFVSNSFHPTIAGQAGYASAFEQAWVSR